MQTIWCPWIFCRAIQTFVIAAKPDRSLVWLVGCSSCKVPFFQSCGTGTHRGGTHLHLFSTSTKDRIPLNSGEHVLFKMFVRGGQIGPESLCILILSFPTGAMTLVRSRGAAAGSVPTSPAGSPACLVTWPTFWSRDHPQGGPAAPQSFLLYLHNRRLTIQCCLSGTFSVKNKSELLLRQAPSSIWFQKRDNIPCWAWCRPAARVGGHVAHAQTSFSVLIRNTAIASQTLATSPPNRHAAVSQWSRRWKLGGWLSPSCLQSFPTVAIACPCLCWPKACPSSDQATATGRPSETEEGEMRAAGSSRGKIESILAAFWQNVSVTWLWERKKWFLWSLRDVYGVHWAPLSWAPRHWLPGNKRKNNCQPCSPAENHVSHSAVRFKILRVLNLLIVYGWRILASIITIAIAQLHDTFYNHQLHHQTSRTCEWLWTACHCGSGCAVHTDLPRLF